MVTDEQLDLLLQELGDQVRARLDAGDGNESIWRFLQQDPRNGYWALLERSARRGWSALSRQHQHYWEWQDLATSANVTLQQRSRTRPDFPWKPTGPFSHWLSTVISNAVKEAARRLKSHSETITFADADLRDDHGTLGRDVIREIEREIALKQAIDLLPLEFRTVIRRRLDGQPQKEIAQELSMSEAKVSNVVTQAVRQLRSILATPGEKIS